MHLKHTLILLCLGLGAGIFHGRANADGDHEAPKDPIVLDVDASDAARKIFHAREVIPVQPGALTLYFPKWIPGNHGPTGRITDLAGIKMKAAGKVVPWKRDEIDMFAFHCDIPEGARHLEINLDALGTGGQASSTAQMAVVRWNQMLLYPKGPSQQELQFRASVTLPADWKFGTALRPGGRIGDLTCFDAVSLETLIDSPVICGAFFKEVSLGTHDGRPHYLELACDSAAGLEISEETRKQHTRLITEAGLLFGARHYGEYRFLVTLSGAMGIHGLEHHESSDNGGPEKMMVDKKARDPIAFLLPHEYVHSWNGKYRRPAGLVTRDFQQPQKTSLLWIYEGLTEYLGTVLTARSGLWSPEETRDYLAITAAKMQAHRGRSWRPLLDTTVGAPLNYFGGGQGWGDWRRGVDYYDEGLLIWLEVDTRIRMLTHGQRSLDDFCQKFFGGANGKPEVKPYSFEDIVAELNAIAPYDWRGLLTRRLTATTADAPLEGITQSGWRLAYGAKPSGFFQNSEGLGKATDLSDSVGLLLSPDGGVIDVVPGSAADRARIGPGMKLLAVNSRKWSVDELKSAIAGSSKPGQHIELLFENGDYFKTYHLEYHDGAKYPKLDRIDNTDDLLGAIMKPRKS